MNIEKKYLKSSNSYNYSVRFYYTDFDNKRKQKRISSCKSEKECREKVNDFLSMKNRKSDITFINAYKNYIDYCENVKNLKETTLETKKNIFEKHILTYFNTQSLSDIDSLTIQDYFKQLSMNQVRENQIDFSETYKKTIKAQLSSFFNYCVDFYDLKKNVCHRVSYGSEQRKRQYDVWTFQDFNTFVKELDNDIMYKTMFTLLFTSGMRESELLALTLKDFDFTNNTVRIVSGDYKTAVITS